MQLGFFEIDAFVTFACNTHDPTTAAAADADSDPAYRVYEDETGTPILTGTMAKLDDANTLGFYSEQIQLTAANGFEVGKSYHIRISATVGGVAGVTIRTLQVKAALASQASVNTIDDFLDTEIAAIKAKTDNLPTDPADASDIATSHASLSTKLDTIDDFLDTEVAAIKAKTDQLAFTTANRVDATVVDKTGFSLSSAGVTAIWDEVIEGASTARHYLRLMASALWGKLSGAGTSTITIRDAGDTKDRITATVDADGNRSAVSTDAT